MSCLRWTNARLATAAIMMLLAGVALAPAGPAGAATGDKSYTAVIAPQPVARGATTAMSATLTNTSNQQQMGSAEITAPAAFTLLAGLSTTTGNVSLSGNTIALRDLSLPPGGTVTVQFQAAVACDAPANPPAWNVVAKQANNFNGPPGNNLTLDAENSDLTVGTTGNCALRFVANRGPADAEVDTIISSEAFKPSGAPIQVEVVDGAGQRVTTSSAVITVAIGPNPPANATLSGDAQEPASSGVASFGTLKLNQAGVGYKLRASSPNLTDATSNPFTIWDTVVRCEPDVSCTGEVSEAKSTTATVTTTSQTGGFLLMSLDNTPLDCGDGTTFNHAERTITVDTSPGFNAKGDKSAELLIDKAVDQLQVNNGASFYQVCYTSPVQFTDRSGETTNLGLLPDCGATAPCVQSRTKTNKGHVLVKLLLPKEDPSFR